MATHKPIDPRTLPEYFEGQKAYKNGATQDDCPYKSGIGTGISGFSERRKAWFTGWLDARTQDNLGHIFKKRGMSYP